MEKEEIRALCRQYTDLTDEEITELLNMSSLLQPMADIEEADMFIDCPMIGGDALVIAEAKPTKVPSSYKTAVAGMFAKQENEPAVARTFRLGIGTRQMKATTQENGVTIQTVEPIRRGERVIGVLIREKRTNEDIQLNEKFHLSGKGYEAIASSLSRISPENNWLTECIDEALLLVNRKGVIVFSNSLARKLYQKVGYVEDIIGQEGAKRGAEIAAAGGHNLIMLGPPGSGKSSLAKAMSGILPPMTHEESVVTSKIYSVYGTKGSGIGLIHDRPFRAPHYSASLPAIIGGGAGQDIRPGEVTLAHNGILFLDEYGQMPKSVLEALRGPMEDRKVTISRLRSKLEYPASFMLVAASNPCPCGYYGEGDRCRCTPGQRAGYLSKLSGPILDRIDIQLWIHPVETRKLVGRKKGETSSDIAARVLEARNIQRKRFTGEGIFTNAEMNGRLLERYCHLDNECVEFMGKIMDKIGLSARAYSRILKVARTIADLENEDRIKPEFLAEAASYRFLDRIEGL